MRLLISAAALLVSSIAVGAEETKSSKIAVHLYQQCADDSVGQRLAFKIKEGLNASTSMRSVDGYDDAAMHLSLVCLSPDIQDRGTFSRYSYQITITNYQGFYDFALTHGVGTCGTQRVTECAEGIVATIDSTIADLRSKIKGGSFKWPN